ncbi:methionyl-tRNA formyltransferase [Legionella sp. W05-934-2]|uniref:methionyl-tRNA formyltransferase n=1 Tax=Legionella sp. W05-934-2 TaxID=1198649 RepID=UPI0034617C1A
MNKPLKILLAGTPDFALPCFEAIAKSHHSVLGVWTQPDRPAGRGRKLQASPVKQWAQEKGYLVHQPDTLRDIEAQEAIRLLKPDVMIVIAYGLILPKAILAIPRFGCINIHASLLPRWRGASPIQQAILAGDAQTGITIMQMDVGMDTGPSLKKIPCPIGNQDTAAVLHDKLAALAASPLLEILERLPTHPVECVPQPEEGVTYAPKISKEDARVNWQQSAWQIDCQVRAFYPWPVAYTDLSEQVRLRIVSGHRVDITTNANPGEIIQLDKQGMVVACGHEAYCVNQLQFPGGKVLSVAEWLASGKKDLAVGQQLLSEAL